MWTSESRQMSQQSMHISIPEPELYGYRLMVAGWSKGFNLEGQKGHRVPIYIIVNCQDSRIECIAYSNVQQHQDTGLCLS